ncbi:MAG: 2'-5' RNA ligase family protein [Candidatus Andersenbacteria bacterium]
MNDSAPGTARLFLGLSVPEKAKTAIRHAAKHYKEYINQPVAEESWHITLLFLGNVENHKQYVNRLIKPLSLSFVPTVSLTHVGRGFQRDQLWAYAAATPALSGLIAELEKRIKAMRMQYEGGDDHGEYTPHIRVATLLDVTRGIGLPDGAARSTFAPSEIYLYRSHQTEAGVHYTVEATIPLTT